VSPQLVVSCVLPDNGPRAGMCGNTFGRTKMPKKGIRIESAFLLVFVTGFLISVRMLSGQPELPHS